MQIARHPCECGIIMYQFTDKSLTPTYRALDTGIALTSLLLALLVGNLPHSATHVGSFLEVRITLKNVLVLSSLTFAWPMLFNAFGLYRLHELLEFGVERTRVAKACAVGSIFALVLALTSQTRTFGILSVLVFWSTATIATLAARAISRKVLKVGASLTTDAHYAIIVGTGPRALRLYRKIAHRTSLEFLGFVDLVAPASGKVAGLPFLGTIDQLEHILISRPVDMVHIRLPVKSYYEVIQQVIAICERVGVESSYQADIFPRDSARPWTQTVGHVVARKVVADDYRLWAKRVIDVSGALFGLVALSPILLAAAIAVKMSGPGPIFFSQERLGFNRRRLRMFKFRTMVADAEARQVDLEQMNEAQGPVFKIRLDPRVTRVGRFLRRTSIDELPQLVNVLTGEMSLVGPRPLPLRDVSRFPEASLMRRFSVKPGLTCLWQIGGRSQASFDRWIEQDLDYIDRWSLTLDFQILAKTFGTVIRGAGAV